MKPRLDMGDRLRAAVFDAIVALAPCTGDTCHACRRDRSAAQNKLRAAYQLQSERDAARTDAERLREALRAICQTNDAGPWIAEYRTAGGGYEGLQAIARAALSGETPNQDTPHAP